MVAGARGLRPGAPGHASPGAYNLDMDARRRSGSSRPRTGRGGARPTATPSGPSRSCQETGATFLNANALEAARARTAVTEAHQSFDHQRLWPDLLWSPALAFNLFDLAADPGLADRAVHTWWPDAPGTVSEVRFAHSRGRFDDRYLICTAPIVRLRDHLEQHLRILGIRVLDATTGHFPPYPRAFVRALMSSLSASRSSSAASGCCGSPASGPGTTSSPTAWSSAPPTARRRVRPPRPLIRSLRVGRRCHHPAGAPHCRRFARSAWNLTRCGHPAGRLDGGARP